ncbi:MAG TPA: hypothetical protein VHT03_04035 [Rhizomicrobium sp.]|jgi:hypothetical protein|nr:hypothetical protein [Rhizomicrobium sp.]
MDEGAFLESQSVHRGIAYSIRRLRDSVWQWNTHPPLQSVRGLAPATGIISGDAKEAIRAAKRTIDSQHVWLR